MKYRGIFGEPVQVVLAEYNFTAGAGMANVSGSEYGEVVAVVSAAIASTIATTNTTVKRLEVLSVTEYLGTGLGGLGLERPVVLGYLQVIQVPAPDTSVTCSWTRR